MRGKTMRHAPFQSRTEALDFMHEDAGRRGLSIGERTRTAYDADGGQVGWYNLSDNNLLTYFTMDPFTVDQLSPFVP